MSKLWDELNQLGDISRDSEDLGALGQAQQRCETILANVTKNLAAESDATVREHLESIQNRTNDIVADLKKRMAEVKIMNM